MHVFSNYDYFEPENYLFITCTPIVHCNACVRKVDFKNDFTRLERGVRKTHFLH